MEASEYVEVILPLPLQGTFTYLLPEAMRPYLKRGSRVIVPFGAKKFYTGIVAGVTPIAPVGYHVKEVLHVLDSEPVLRHPQLRLWDWISEYYLSSIGEVYRAAVPSGLKIESETMFEVNPDYDLADSEDGAGLQGMSEREVIVFQMLGSKGKLSAKQIEKETGFSKITRILQHLCDMGAVIVSESLVERYRAKKENYVEVAFERGSDDAHRAAFQAVKGAPKQEQMLLTLLHLTNFMAKEKPLQDVKVKDLLDASGGTSATLKTLVDKGLATRYTREISRFKYTGVPRELPTLSDAQAEALKQIHQTFKDKNVTLLHGVTSSGKTEVYMHLINHVLEQERQQVLMLVPEISLTTQLTQRLQSVFGDKVVVYHSKFTDNERVDIWRKLLHSSQPCVVVGPRSALFLPFAKLGLVIVDEEHDSSFKQHDPAPRYNGRDTAIVLASLHGAKTLLGSATPAVETYWKATNGKYGLVSLSERYGGAQLPRIEIVDMVKAGKQKAVRGQFAQQTIAGIRGVVQSGGQAIIFHNRRGYSPMARCTKCQYIPKCLYCDVSLTYHKRANTLICHYCGAHYPMPETCPVCKEPSVEIVGYGTERIEDEVEQIFTEARSLRMDLDTTRNKNSYQNIINDFSDHKADILVGTQMVTKGLDFGDVGIVAIANADALINFPDFRAGERAFNQMSQVAGRAGRRDTIGKVLIQTRQPDHPIIRDVIAQDYEHYYEQQIEERRLYNYPPFTRLIYINLKHLDERQLDETAADMAARLRVLFGNRVAGPARPGIARIQSLYIRQIMLKVELNASMPKVKELMRGVVAEIHRDTTVRNLIVSYDVDPA